MSNRKQNPLRKMLEDIKNQKVDITQPIKPAETTAEKMLAMIREQKVDTIYSKDPRVNLPDPETVSKEEYDYHVNICDDIDLLAKTLGPDEWDDDL